MSRKRNFSRTSPHRGARTWFFVLLSSIAAVGGTVVALGASSQPPKLDAETLCRVQQPIHAHTVLFVDTTDRLLDTHVRQLRTAIAQERDALPVHGKFTLLFLAAASPYGPEELVSLCNPGDGSTLNPLYEGQALARRRWKQAFGEPIQQAVARLAVAPEADRSPILQGIAAIGRRADFSSAIARRRLVLVSDLLQHDPGVYTHYSAGNIATAFRGSALAGQTASRLDGATVRIEYLQRPQAIQFQGDRHLAFWTRWLRDAGATEIVVDGRADRPS